MFYLFVLFIYHLIYLSYTFICLFLSIYLLFTAVHIRRPFLGFLGAEGANQRVFRGGGGRGGMDIFWNHTLASIKTSIIFVFVSFTLLSDLP